jgi:hypothetical protein
LGGILLGPLASAVAIVIGWFVATLLAPASFIFGIGDVIVWLFMGIPVTLHMFKWPESLDKLMWWVGFLLPAIMMGGFYLFAVQFWAAQGINLFATPLWYFYTTTDGWPSVILYMLTYKWHREWISNAELTPEAIGKLTVAIAVITYAGVGAGNWSSSIFGLPAFNFPPDFLIGICITSKWVERIVWTAVGTAIGVPLLLALKRIGLPKPQGTIW